MTQERTTRPMDNLDTFGHCWDRMERSVAYETSGSENRVVARGGDDNRLCLFSTNITGVVQQKEGKFGLGVDMNVSWITADESAWVNTEEQR